MNRIIRFTIIILIVSLVACTNAMKDDIKENNSSEKTEQQHNEDNQTEENNKQKENEDITVNKEENNPKEKKESKYELNENWYLVPEDDEVNDEIVLLTIDDAPDQYSLEMAKTLKELDA